MRAAWARRGWLNCLAGGTMAAALFAIYLNLRDDAGASGIVDNWDQVALAGVAGALVALVMSALGCWHHVRAARQLAAHLQRSSKTPSRQLLLDDPEAELLPLLGPLDAMLTAYRQSLADRVALEESVESLRNLLGQVETEKGMRLTVRGSGSSRNMVGRLTANLSWLTATPALQSFLRTTAEDLNARPFLDLVHPHDRSLIQGTFKEAAQTGEAHNIAFRILPRGHGDSDTERLIRHVSIDVLTRYGDQEGDQGDILHFRCFFDDISSRVRAEKELRRRTAELSQTNEQLQQINQDLERLKESYRDLYHHAPVMYFSLDARGQFVTFNDTMLAVLGYQRDDLYKHAYARLLPPAQQVEWAIPQGQADIEGPVPVTHALGREGEVETRWIKKDGSVIDVWIRSVPVQDADGRFVRSRSAAMDVTERNRLSNELRARGDQLERANIELRHINRELEEFTSVVSHDLKEPLRTLQAFSNFLAEDFSAQLGPDGFQYINHLVQASQRLGTLIDDLLMLGTAGRITQDLQAVDMNDIAATVRRDLADMLQRKNAHLVVESALPTIIGDPQRITQLLSNLVGNALKYNSSPIPVVTIGPGPTCPAPSPAAHGAYLSGDKPPAWTAFPQATLYVRDNGIGIDPRYHQQIFGIFRRLHKSEDYEGTGAGLAICKKIVEGHAGRIWLESQPGQGSTFYFTLPAAPIASPVQTSAAPVETASEQETTYSFAQDTQGTQELRADKRHPVAATAAHPQAETILLVDDMPEISMIVQKISARGGYQVHWLRTAEEAWDFVQNQRPRLMLLDVHLTGMSGGDLCRKLRNLPHLEGVPIALFTQGVVDEGQARSWGAERVLSKELLCRPDEWLAQLGDLLQCKSKAPKRDRHAEASRPIAGS